MKFYEHQGLQVPHDVPVASRRDFLLRGGAGFGALALSGLLETNPLFAKGAKDAGNPLAAKRPHFAPTAKSCIFLFMEGGPSHLDLFDPKPLVKKLAGQSLPPSFKRPITAMGETESPILHLPRKWKQHGQSGLWVSDWLPRIAECMDDIAVIRSCWTNGINHSGGVCQMNTGQPLAGRPSLGAWVSYGLGSENENLPSFVVITDTPAAPANGPRNWSAGFMPAMYQGVRLNPGKEPIRNLNLPKGTSPEQYRKQLDFLRRLNEQHLKSREHQTELEARIRAYELAYRMQASAPEAVDLSRETEATKKLYGFDQKETKPFGQQLLAARRFAERGVRIIQIMHGSGAAGAWDQHSNLKAKHSELAMQVDRPVAGLLKDLKSRGMLDETLVVFATEFGRTPGSQGSNGRDHHPYGFSVWMAGGGLKGGIAHGTTDEIGFHTEENPHYVTDVHATLLHQLGLEPERMEVPGHKRLERDFGHVIKDIIA